MPRDVQNGKNGKPLILLVDSESLIGEGLALRLSETATVVLVGKKKPDADSSIIYIPLTTLPPQLPQGTYSHMVFVYSEKATHLLGPLAQKCREDGATCILVASKENYQKVLEERERSAQFAGLVVVGDLFGEGVLSPLEYFLRHTKQTKRIELANMGLSLWYPVLLSDCTQTLATLLFVNAKWKELFLGPSHGTTELSLSHGLQKIDREILIDFQHKITEVKEGLPAMKSVLQDYKGLEKLQEHYKSLFIQKSEAVPIVSAVFTAPKKKRKNNWWIYLLYIVLVGLFMPFVLLVVSASLGGFFLQTAISDAKNLQLQNAMQKAQAAKTFFSLAHDADTLTHKELEIIGQERLLTSLDESVIFGEKISDIAREGIGVANRVQAILSGTTLTPEDDVNQVVSSEKHIALLFQAIDQKKIPNSYRSAFVGIEQGMQLVGQVIDEAPQLIGAIEDKTYLVLFQNNMELRPGGGFIGSYGLLKLSKGKVKEFSIHDVYEADGQLKGHIEPPFAIRRYVSIVNLYLRDSNFDVDFIKNAENVSRLFFIETGIKVDGVVGVDLTAVKGLLSSVGNVYVPSLGKTVDENNFFLLAESASEKGFFPGSNQKETFLKSFFSSLMQKLGTKGGIRPDVLLQKGIASLMEKHLLVAFANPAIQEPFTLSGLSSSLVDSRKQDASTINDFLGTSEANVGGNKVNAFITRSLTQNVVVKDTGQIIENATLHFINASTGEWPGGAYRTYLRFIVPAGTTLSSVSVNGQEQKIVDAIVDPAVYERKGFTAPSGLEIEKTTEQGKQLFGFFVSVPAGGEATVSISYGLGQKLPQLLAGESYSLLLFKQPGTDSYQYSLRLTLPDSLLVRKATGGLTTQGTTSSYNATLATDKVINFSLVSR